jgi:hypothetical protein
LRNEEQSYDKIPVQRVQLRIEGKGRLLTNFFPVYWSTVNKYADKADEASLGVKLT